MLQQLLLRHILSCVGKRTAEIESGPLPEKFGLAPDEGNLAEVVFGNLLRAADSAARATSGLLQSAHGISLVQYNVLRTIRARGSSGVPVLTIARELISGEPDITRLIDRMERDELLYRQRSEEDRRVVLVFLTPRGRRVADAMKKPLVDFHRRNFRKFTRAELNQLNHWLYRFRVDLT